MAGFFITGFRLGNEFTNIRVGFVGLAAIFGLGAVAVVRGGRNVLLAPMATVWLIAVPTIMSALAYGLQDGIEDKGYFSSAAFYAAHAAATVLYGKTLFDPQAFIAVWWCLTRLSLLVALLGYLLAVTVGVDYLVVRSEGVPRLTGTLSEPSAWAAVLPASLAYSYIRRKWRWFLVSAFAVYLTQSPTVLLVCVLTFFALLFLRRGLTVARVMAILTVAAGAPLLAELLTRVSSRDLVQSDGPALRVIGRLLSGFENISSGGSEGANSRAEGLRVVTYELQENPAWAYFGRGLGSSDVYFYARYEDVQAYNLPAMLVFDLGLFVTVLFYIMLLVAVLRLRTSALLIVLLPAVVATCINSAQGVQSYKLTLLTVILGLTFCRSREARSGFEPCGEGAR